MSYLFCRAVSIIQACLWTGRLLLGGRPACSSFLQIRSVHEPGLKVVGGQDGKTRTRVLTGRHIFLFGGHAKGGGCDWILPVTNIKFHSRLVVTPASGWTGYRVTLAYFCKQVGLWQNIDPPL